MLITTKLDEFLYVSTTEFLAEQVYRPVYRLLCVWVIQQLSVLVKLVRARWITISIAGKSYFISSLYEVLIPAGVVYCNILWNIYLKRNIKQSINLKANH